MTQTWKSSARKEVPALLLWSIAKVYFLLSEKCMPDIFPSDVSNVFERSNCNDHRCKGFISFWELVKLGWGETRSMMGTIEFLLPRIAEHLVMELEIPKSLKDHFQTGNDNNFVYFGNRGIHWINHVHSFSAMLKKMGKMNLISNVDITHCPFGFERWRCLCMVTYALRLLKCRKSMGRCMCLRVCKPQ